MIGKNKNLHKALRVGPREDERLSTLVLGNLWDVASGIMVQSATLAFTSCMDEMYEAFTFRAKEMLFDVPDGSPADHLMDCIEKHFDMLMNLGVLNGHGSVKEHLLETLGEIAS